MKIINRDIQYFIDRMKNREYFAQAGFSDAEFYCMMNIRSGTCTGLGQVIDPTYGIELIDVMQRRQEDENFIFAVPMCLQDLPAFEGGRIDSFVGGIEAVERDMITDDLARNALMFPFIEQLRKMDVVVIGNRHLAYLDFMEYRHVQIDSPNLHLQIEPNGIQNAVNEAASVTYEGGTAFMVSAGVSAAVIIDKLYAIHPDNFYFDCGSNWDAFVGCGRQRSWRKYLYAHPQELELWKKANTNGGIFEWRDTPKPETETDANWHR